MGGGESKEQHHTTPVSRQMLYDVYDCTMGMVQELEKHEKHGKHISVNQEHKENVDVGIELNLKCLQLQKESLPQENFKDLVEQTVERAARREAQDIPDGKVDHYCKNVLEILLFGKTKELLHGHPKNKISTEQVNGALYQMEVQRHLGEKQNKTFHQDSTKEAKCRTKREIEDLRQGALRLAKDDFRLKEELVEQLEDAARDLACFQMLFDAYEKTIGMIEELGKHETHGKQTPADPHKIHEKDVIRDFQDQMESLPPEITSLAKRELVLQTIKWLASRKTRGIPDEKVDHYCNIVLEILLDGARETKESVDSGRKLNNPTEKVEEKKQKQEQEQEKKLIKKFKQDLNKKAELQRQGTPSLTKSDPKLMKAVWKRLPVLEKHAPKAMDKACCQMLYDVYDYTIAMIEELEKHESHGKEIQNSGILKDLIPVHKKIPLKDVNIGIELNLKDLQDQIKSLPEVTNAAKKDLVEQTIKWEASREAQGIPDKGVDHYCKSVLKILLFDEPIKLPNVDGAQEISFTTEQVPKLMDQMKEQIDLGEKIEYFFRHPKKKAELRNKRQRYDLRQGALRLARDDRRLRDFFKQEGYLPDEAMGIGARYDPRSRHDPEKRGYVPEGDHDHQHQPYSGYKCEYFDQTQGPLPEKRKIALSRPIQASKTVLYDVYNYTMGMIAELEKHETQREKSRNSGNLSHPIPVDQKPPEKDVILNLKRLQDQIKSLPPEVTNAAEKDLVEQTIKWAAIRETRGIPYGKADRYYKSVLEILLFGEFKELPSVNQDQEIRFTIEIMDQMEKQMQEFAKLRNDKQTEDLRRGALRLARDDPRLRQVLEKKGYVPDKAMKIASLPMLYNVYDYTMGMIQELERHETDGKQISIVNKVIVGIELNLKCLKYQMKSLPSEVTNAAKKDLVKQTIKWAANRETQGIPYEEVDNYYKSVLEILLLEPKKLPSGAQKIKITTEHVNGALHQTAVQRHLWEIQNKTFHQDSTKEAKCRTKREIEDLRQGARRLAKNNNELKEALKKELTDAAKNLASFQMLYDVYDYNIGMLEELEKHEKHGKQIHNSGILKKLIHGNKMSKNDVNVGIRLNLKCLQDQMKSLPPEVTNEAEKDLVEQTIKWAANREAQGIPDGEVDRYCRSLLEILLFGEFKELPSVDQGQEISDIPDQVRKLMDQMKEQIDLEKKVEEFSRHLEKKAELCNKRQTDDLRQGALRLAKDDRRLRDFFKQEGYFQYEAMEKGALRLARDDRRLRDFFKQEGYLPDEAMGIGARYDPRSRHDPEKRGYVPDEDAQDTSNHTDRRNGGLFKHCQIELHRTIQASIQMLYDVYDYTIGMIEELEKHETHEKQIHNSGILSHLIPVNHRNHIHDVIGGIELELKCLQAQMKSLPPEVTNAAKKDLVFQTIKWAASREAQDIPRGHVDHYCKNVLEILLYCAPKKLPDVEHAQESKLTNKQVNEVMHQMEMHRHRGKKQDEEFKRDPTKKAKLRYKKQVEDLRAGALRLAGDDPRLRHDLEEKGYVPDLLMDVL